jgi:hypothetical protein
MFALYILLFVRFLSKLVHILTFVHGRTLGYITRYGSHNKADNINGFLVRQRIQFIGQTS